MRRLSRVFGKALAWWVRLVCRLAERDIVFSLGEKGFGVSAVGSNRGWGWGGAAWRVGRFLQPPLTGEA